VLHISILTTSGSKPDAGLIPFQALSSKLYQIMVTSINVKPATLEDAEAIGQIQTASWRATYQGIVPDAFLATLSAKDKTAMWQRILTNPNPVKAGDILVARKDDPSDQAIPQVLGFVSFGSADDSSKFGTKRDTEVSRQGELRAIYVDPQHLSEGVGRCLWAAAEEKMIDMKYSTIVVLVFAGNVRAVRFYQKAGFTKC
jgi:ribosomal protein S18 acetylase RimI-like enzyme